MTIPAGERRRRREAERGRDAAVTDDARTDGRDRASDRGLPTGEVPRQASAPVEQATAVPEDRPLSRRELRERERHRATTVRDPVDAPATDLPDDVDHGAEPGFSWKHGLALAVVAGVFAVLISSLTSSDLGALGAAAAEPITSPSASPTPLRGEP